MTGPDRESSAPLPALRLSEVICHSAEAFLFAENFLLVRPREDEGTPVPSSEE
jgi:hypothetical protein